MLRFLLKVVCSQSQGSVCKDLLKQREQEETSSTASFPCQSPHSSCSLRSLPQSDSVPEEWGSRLGLPPSVGSLGEKFLILLANIFLKCLSQTLLGNGKTTWDKTNGFLSREQNSKIQVSVG